jgi:ADP-heptose:LPS heptosyltransferase
LQKNRVKNKQVKILPKFLILRFSSIGDIILTTPVIRCLKKQIPNAQIHFATKKQNEILLLHNPYISKIHKLQINDNELIKELKAEKFDYIIDLHHNLRTLRIKWALGVPSFSFDKLNWQKWLLVNLKINKMPNLHIVDRYLATLHSFGVQNDLQGLDYFIPTTDQHSLPQLQNRNYIAYAIGGQHFTKKLPAYKMAEMLANINEPLVLIGGPEDNTEAIKLKALLPNKEIYNTCGSCNLNQSASLLQHAQMVYTHDTGMMHVAAALKKKVISIWGNTTPSFGMQPYLTDYQVIENNNLSCRPCSKIGYKACPKQHFKCMEALQF